MGTGNQAAFAHRAAVDRIGQQVRLAVGFAAGIADAGAAAAENLAAEVAQRSLRAGALAVRADHRAGGAEQPTRRQVIGHEMALALLYAALRAAVLAGKAGGFLAHRAAAGMFLARPLTAGWTGDRAVLAEQFLAHAAALHATLKADVPGAGMAMRQASGATEMLMRANAQRRGREIAAVADGQGQLARVEVAGQRQLQ